MATHSSVLAWRIPGTAESGGLLSTGSHRVGHDWSDLAATTAAYSIHRFSTSLANLYSCIYFEVSVMTDATISRKFLMSIFSSVQSLSHVWLFLTPWIAARQELVHHQLPEFTKPMSIDSVIPSSHLILCCPFLLLPPIPLSIRLFSNESTLLVRWPKYWSFTFSISSSNKHHWSPLGWTGWISLQSKGLSRVFSNTTVQKHQFLGTQFSSQSNSHIHTWPLEKP